MREIAKTIIAISVKLMWASVVVYFACQWISSLDIRGSSSGENNTANKTLGFNFVNDDVTRRVFATYHIINNIIHIRT